MHRYASFLLIVTCLLQSPAAIAAITTTPVTTVEHALGEATIAGRPDRVVSLYQGATDTAVALGINPIGVVESWTEKPMYQYLREDLQGVTYLGLETQPDLERIAWLSPDLIVGARNRHRTIYPLLERIAPTVIPGNVAPCSGPTTCTIPWRGSLILNSSMPYSTQLSSRVCT